MKKVNVFFVLLSLIFSVINTQAQTGATCTDAQIITVLPFSQTGMSTVNGGDNYDNLPCSQSGLFNYMAGNEYLFTYTPLVNETVGVIVTGSGTAVGLFITDLCPDDTNVTCIANNNAILGNPVVSNISLVAGTQYFIIVARASATTNFNISISSCTVAPVANFTYQDNGGGNLSFNSSGTTDADSYEWYFGYAPVYPLPAQDTLPNPTYQYSVDGNYTVYLIVKNSCGSDTMSVDVTIIGTNIVYHNFSEFPDIYPVPAKEILKISYGLNFETGSLLISDLLGHEIIYENIAGGIEKQIDLKNFQKGIYFIKINTKNKTFTAKFIIE